MNSNGIPQCPFLGALFAPMNTGRCLGRENSMIRQMAALVAQHQRAFKFETEKYKNSVAAHSFKNNGVTVHGQALPPSKRELVDADLR